MSGMLVYCLTCLHAKQNSRVLLSRSWSKDLKSDSNCVACGARIKPKKSAALPGACYCRFGKASNEGWAGNRFIFTDLAHDLRQSGQPACEAVTSIVISLRLVPIFSYHPAPIFRHAGLTVTFQQQQPRGFEWRQIAHGLVFNVFPTRSVMVPTKRRLTMSSRICEHFQVFSSFLPSLTCCCRARLSRPGGQTLAFPFLFSLFLLCSAPSLSLLHILHFAQSHSYTDPGGCRRHRTRPRCIRKDHSPLSAPQPGKPYTLTQIPPL